MYLFLANKTKHHLCFEKYIPWQYHQIQMWKLFPEVWDKSIISQYQIWKMLQLKFLSFFLYYPIQYQILLNLQQFQCHWTLAMSAIIVHVLETIYKQTKMKIPEKVDTGCTSILNSICPALFGPCGNQPVWPTIYF